MERLRLALRSPFHVAALQDTAKNWPILPKFPRVLITFDLPQAHEYEFNIGLTAPGCFPQIRRELIPPAQDVLRV